MTTKADRPTPTPADLASFGESAPGGRDLVAAVLDTVASLVVVLDAEGRILRFNRACEQTTGYSSDEVLGKSVFDLLVPAEEVAAVRDTLARLRSGDFPNRHRNRWRTKSGADRVLDWVNTCVVDAHGE